MTPPKSPPQPAVSVDLACPFCGGEVEWQKGADKVHPYRGVCKSCGSGTAHHGSFQACIKAWQTRAAPPADGVLREALEDALKFIVGDISGESQKLGIISQGIDALNAWDVAAPKAPTAPIGEDGVSAPGADGLKSIGHDLAMAAGNLVVATDGQEAIRAERIAVLNALKAWEKTLADRAQGEGEKAS